MKPLLSLKSSSKYLFLLSLVLISCQTSQSDCIDSSKIKTDAICTMQYEPVCGCDGKTYSNPCVAENAGVTSFVKGECPDQ